MAERFYKLVTCGGLTDVLGDGGDNGAGSHNKHSAGQIADWASALDMEEAGVKLTVRSVFEAPAERIWNEVRKVSILSYVASPMQVFEPLEPPELPEFWTEGKYLVHLWFLGVLPLGKQWIVISYPKTALYALGEYTLRDRGHGDLISVWDHVITIKALPGDRSEYRDDVEIEAGVITPAIWCFAWAFYRHRQRRWRGLVAAKFDYRGHGQC